MTKTIVHHKHKKNELYDSMTIYDSVLSFALADRMPEGKAEDIAERVMHDVDKWADGRPAITGPDIRRVAAKSLAVFDKDLAEAYANYDSII